MRLSWWTALSLAAATTLSLALGRSSTERLAVDLPPTRCTPAQENVVGILTTSVVDVLSHVAIRARSQDVMLASCSDADEFAKLDELQGKIVVAKVGSSGSVEVEETTRAAKSGAATKAPRKALKLQTPDVATSKSAWVLSENQFTSGRVGKKALNLKTFRETLPKGCVHGRAEERARKTAAARPAKLRAPSPPSVAVPKRSMHAGAREETARPSTFLFPCSPPTSRSSQRQVPVLGGASVRHL